MKKLDMAEAAEQFLVGTNQLPALLRTPLTQPEQMAASNGHYTQNCGEW